MKKETTEFVGFVNTLIVKINMNNGRPVLEILPEYVTFLNLHNSKVLSQTHFFFYVV